MASIRRRPGRPSPWEAVFRDPSGRQQTRAFRRKLDAQRWLDEQTTAIVSGQYVSPDAARVTVREYGEQWRATQVHRASSADKIESISGCTSTQRLESGSSPPCAHPTSRHG